VGGVDRVRNSFAAFGCVREVDIPTGRGALQEGGCTRVNVAFEKLPGVWEETAVPKKIGEKDPNDRENSIEESGQKRTLA